MFLTAVWFTASATASETDFAGLNARQILLMPLAVGPPQAWARNMAAAMVSRLKPDGWIGSWPVYRNEQLNKHKRSSSPRPMGVVKTELTKTQLSLLV